MSYLASQILLVQLLINVNTARLGNFVRIINGAAAIHVVAMARRVAGVTTIRPCSNVHLERNVVVIAAVQTTGSVTMVCACQRVQPNVTMVIHALEGSGAVVPSAVDPATMVTLVTGASSYNNWFYAQQTLSSAEPAVVPIRNNA